MTLLEIVHTDQTSSVPRLSHPHARMPRWPRCGYCSRSAPVDVATKMFLWPAMVPMLEHAALTTGIDYVLRCLATVSVADVQRAARDVLYELALVSDVFFFFFFFFFFFVSTSFLAAS